MDSFIKFFDDWGFAGWLVPSIALIAILFFIPWELFASTLRSLFWTLPLFGLFVLSHMLAEEWMAYVQVRRFYELEHVILEVRLPAEITKSPAAMETALNSFFYTGEPAKPSEKYLEGRLRPQFSLEIVSLEGEVHFYIHTRVATRTIIETALYAQYPTIEIHEVPDPINRIHYDRSKMNLYGIEQILQKPDPYPINTYANFGLDEQTKEEFKIDPMLSLLEFFGSFGKGEYGFFQLIIRSHQEEKHAHGKLFKKEDWKAEAKREIDKLIDSAQVKSGDFTIYRPRKDIQDIVEAVARNVAKKPFDAGVRILYTADNEHFDKNRQGGLPTMMRAFETHHTNGFKPVFPLNFKYWWQDPFGNVVEKRRRALFDAYRWRSYFAPPYPRPFFVLSSEEVATVWHLPGLVAATPTLARIPSRRAEAPSNLPQ